MWYSQLSTTTSRKSTKYSIIINNRNLVVSRKKRNISQILSNNNISRGSSGGSGYGRYVRGRKNSR